MKFQFKIAFKKYFYELYYINIYYYYFNYFIFFLKKDKNKKKKSILKLYNNYMISRNLRICY